jgi:hypothetical protein
MQFFEQISFINHCKASRNNWSNFFTFGRSLMPLYTNISNTTLAQLKVAKMGLDY